MLRNYMAPVAWRFRPGTGPTGPCLICHEPTEVGDLRYQTLVDGKHFAQAGVHRACVRLPEAWRHDPAHDSNNPGELTT